MENNQIWIENAISHWISSGIKLQKGISIEKIQEFEKILGFQFPQDFIDLYSKVNGFEDFDWNESMFSLWSLERILKEYQESAEPNFIAFCDYLIVSHRIGFSKINAEIFKDYNLDKSISATFKESIELITKNSNLIY